MINKILEYLFRSYTKQIREEASRDADLKFEAYKRTLDIKDLIRERFNGLRIGRPDEDSRIKRHLATLEDDASRLAFLGKAYDIIKNNQTFKIVADSIIEESEHKGSLYSSDMPEVNFNRSSVNGVMLLEEELTLLSSMYIAEKDKSLPMTEEEKQAIIN